MIRFLYILLALLLTISISAEDKKSEALLNKLFAPGPLIGGHKDYEGTGCLECHDAGKGIPDSKCTACHKEIKPFVSQKTGFHGRAKEDCFKCHSDHKGRDFDSTKVDKNTFDHKLTGYELVGEHSTIDCNECHLEKRKEKYLRKGDIRYLGLTTSCKKCHKDDDVHKFKGKWAKQDCNKCHGLKKWKTEVKFDHEKDAEYRLKGAHKKTDCNECHIQKNRSGVKFSIYEWPKLKKQKCLSCHQDQHKTNLSPKFRGGDCTKCHSEDKWEIKKFDHAITRFKLKGEHRKSKCTDCHKQRRGVKSKNFKWSGLKTSCISCHEDIHDYGKKISKRLGKLTKCETCHEERSWEKIHRFNHNKDTRYPVTGKHLKLKCSECHTSTKKIGKKVVLRRYFWKHLTAKTCENCHKSPHKKEFSKKFLKKKCTDCHVSSGWDKKPGYGKNFKHSETRFKLTGDHKKAKCSSCHVINDNQVFQFKSVKKEFCIDCHDNPHLKQFHRDTNRQACSKCHNTTNFKNTWRFKHNKTEFALKGRHKKLKCKECHTKSKPFFTKAEQKPKVWHKYVFKNLEKDGCTTCHNDFHAGQFEKKDCAECHSEKKWRKTKFNHNKDSDFPLTGKHKKVTCKKCHLRDKSKRVRFGKKNKSFRVRQYKLGDPSCYSCHKSDDEHKGQFGKDCNQCHSDKSWKRTKDFHRDYTLHGAHFTAECKECHIDKRKLTGMSENCQSCHQKDDIHSGSLPSCESCHVQQYWEHSKFRHSMTFFPLRGMHRTLDCFQCHTSNRYEGTKTECIDCHEKDRVIADATSTLPHTLPTVNECDACHNQFTWPGASP